MSQFILVWGEPPHLGDEPGLALIPVRQAQEYVRRAATSLLSESEYRRAWQVVDGTGDTGSELVEAVTNGYMEGRSFEGTHFARFLARLPGGASIALWGGYGWAELKEFVEFADFVAFVKQELARDWEVYAVLRRASSGGEVPPNDGLKVTRHG